MFRLGLLVGLVFGVGLTNAFPSAWNKRGMRRTRGTVKRQAFRAEDHLAIDPPLFEIFNLMEQYASAAYCSNNFNSPGDKIMCHSGNCPLVQAANATSLIEFSEM